MTGNTYAAFEPALDYVAVKFPKWPFEKFVYAERTLGTQMKATGEVMSISDSFESAIMKAVRGAEISTETLSFAWIRALTDGELYMRGKKLGFTDRSLETISGHAPDAGDGGEDRRDHEKAL